MFCPRCGLFIFNLPVTAKLYFPKAMKRIPVRLHLCSTLCADAFVKGYYLMEWAVKEARWVL